MVTPPTAPPRPSISQVPGAPIDPFAPDLNNFFEESSRRQRLDLLYSLICYGRSPLILCGPPGAGKTTLLLQLQKRVGRTQPTALLSAYSELAVEALLDEAQRQFTVALAAGGLEGALGAVLMVDDADTLSDIVLKVLLTPVSGQEGQVRILLSGAPGLETRILASMDGRAPVAKVLELFPFSADDSARFLRTRLGAAGIQAHPLLLPRALKRLHRESGGWPGALVTRARAALTTPVIIPPPPPPAPPPAPPKPMAKKKPVRPTASRLRHNFFKGLRRAIHSYWLWPALALVTLGVLFGLWPKETAPLLPGTNPPLSSLPPPPVWEIPPPPPEKLPETKVVTPDAVPPLVPVVKNPPAAVPTTTPPPPSVPPANPPREPSAPPAAGPVGDNPGSLRAQSEKWLRAQRPQDYTLQLRGGNTEAPLQELVRTWKLPGEMAIAHTLRGGRDWYTLLYGAYANYQQAEEAARRLPSAIGKPWIRTLGSVQKDLQ